MSPNWFVAVPIAPESWFGDDWDPPIKGLWRVHPRDLHMTVAFLGAAEECQAREAFALHNKWTHGPIDAQAGPIIPLGDPHRYSALVLTLSKGSENAKALMSCLGPAMREQAGIPAESRPPLPHVTVVRAKRRTGKQERADGLRWSKTLTLPSLTFPLHELALYRGRATEDGPRYEIVERVSL